MVPYSLIPFEPHPQLLGHSTLPISSRQTLARVASRASSLTCVHVNSALDFASKQAPVSRSPCLTVHLLVAANRLISTSRRPPRSTRTRAPEVPCAPVPRRPAARDDGNDDVTPLRRDVPITLVDRVSRVHARGRSRSRRTTDRSRNEGQERARDGARAK